MSSFAAASRRWKANSRLSPQSSILQTRAPSFPLHTVRPTNDDVRFGSKADIARKVRLMSALPPKADIPKRDWHVRFVPLAEVGTILEPLAIPMRVASQHSLTSFRTDLM